MSDNHVGITDGVAYGVLESGEVRSGHALLPARYARRLHAGLLALSQSQEHAQAVREWRYRRECGYSATQRVCDICGCSRVQYWFKLHNAVTGRVILVGSECIQHWDNPALRQAVNEDRARLVRARGAQRRIEELRMAARSSRWVRDRLPEFEARVHKYGKLSAKVARIVDDVLARAGAAGGEA